MQNLAPNPRRGGMRCEPGEAKLPPHTDFLVVTLKIRSIKQHILSYGTNVSLQTYFIVFYNIHVLKMHNSVVGMEKMCSFSVHLIKSL